MSPPRRRSKKTPPASGPAAPPAAAPSVEAPVFHNREWSWLRFNERVLEEAEDPKNPLLERAKFLAIFCSNLDEFFMVRVGGLYRQVEAGIEHSGPDQRPPQEQIAGIADLVHELTPRQEACLQGILEQLAAEGIRLHRTLDDLDAGQRAYLDRYYEEVVYPVITPMIVGPTHPFPTLHNNTLYLALRLSEKPKKKKKKDKSPKRKGKRPASRGLVAFLGLPRVLPRLVRIGAGEREQDLVPTEVLVAARMAGLFSDYHVRSMSLARVTRDADFIIDEEAAEDFREAMARKILGRRHGAAVRLQFSADMDPQVLSQLQARLEVDPRQHYPYSGLLQARDLMELPGLLARPDLAFAPRKPLLPAGTWREDVFGWLRRAPRLVHLPYHAFDPVAELAVQAADDPDVLAIKQTLYRTSGDSPVVRALTRAAEKGKHVTAVVELRARFDEERNIEWAQRLEQAGAHVVYGLVGYKTHCKCLLVVRREAEGIVRYAHFGTGNYNDATAKLYTDVGLMVCDDRYGEDASALFNLLTGATLPPRWNRAVVSPTAMRRRLLHLIEREIGKSAPRRRGHIRAKMNSLVDREVIEALYRASRAGVKVDLVVRGICCLSSGVPGLSENIRVVSVVGRYLEHSRLFWFRNGGKEELYLSSADWMPRNLDHRVELMVPVEDPAHRAYLRAVLDLQLKDNVKAREQRPDGTYGRVTRGKRKVHSQDAVFDLTLKQLGEPEKPALPDHFTPIRTPGGR